MFITANQSEIISAQESDFGCGDVLSVLPGSIATVACLVGFVALNVLRYHYFSIVFGVGTIASACSIYQGYNARSLKSLRDGNHSKEALIHELRREIYHSTDQISEFGSQNVALSKNISELKIENQQLKNNTEKLQEEIVSLSELNATLEKNMKMQHEQQNALVSSLKELESAVFDDHRVFGEKVTLFCDKVSSLKLISEGIDTTFEVYNKQTIDLGAQIERIFVELEKWKSQDFIQERLDFHKDLRQLICEQQKEIAMHAANIGRHKGCIAAMNQNIEDLKLTEAKYRDVLKDLRKEIHRLEQVSKDLSLKTEVKMKLEEIKEKIDNFVLPPIIIELLQML